MPEGKAARGGQPQDEPAPGLQLVAPLAELALRLVEPLQGKARGQACGLLQTGRQPLIQVPLDLGGVVARPLLEQGGAGVHPQPRSLVEAGGEGAAQQPRSGAQIREGARGKLQPMAGAQVGQALGDRGLQPGPAGVALRPFAEAAPDRLAKPRCRRIRPGHRQSSRGRRPAGRDRSGNGPGRCGSRPWPRGGPA